MKYRLHQILSNMMGHSTAILRYKTEDNIASKPVQMTDHRLQTVICCLEEGEILPAHNKNVSLIIKNEEHYFHGSGEVLRSFLNGRIFTVELLNATLFVRKETDHSSWLEQLYKYEPSKA